MKQSWEAIHELTRNLTKAHEPIPVCLNDIMSKLLLSLLLTVLAAATPVGGQQNSSHSPAKGRDERAVEEALQSWWTASMKTHDQRIAWWRESEFGCFIHWGVYSSFGGEWKGKPFRGYAEHMMRSQKIPRSEYAEKVVSVFNPVKFDAEEWIRLIKAAGMKYVIITAKHHDGFAMYPSAVSGYATERTPLPVQPWGESTRRASTLYLHVFDWPRHGRLTLGGLKSNIKRAYLLGDPKRTPLKTVRLNEKDVVIHVPQEAPNSVDAVVALEISGPMDADPVRLLSSREQSNVLRSFDGVLHGGGLRFGDGKAARAYVFEWRNPTDWIGWQTRLDEPAEFEVLARYTTGSLANRGTYTVTIGDQVLRATVEPTPNENEAAFASLGHIKLNTGSYEISVKPVEIEGGELMRLFHLELRPVRKE